MLVNPRHRHLQGLDGLLLQALRAGPEGDPHHLAGARQCRRQAQLAGLRHDLRLGVMQSRQGTDLQPQAL